MLKEMSRKNMLEMSNILWYSLYISTTNLVIRISKTVLVDYFILFILHRQLLRTGIQFQTYFYTRFDYIAMQLDIITRTSAFCIKHRFLQVNSSSFSNLLLCRISLSRTSIYIVFIYSYYCYKEKLSNMLNHHCKSI